MASDKPPDIDGFRPFKSSGRATEFIEEGRLIVFISDLIALVDVTSFILSFWMSEKNF